MKTILKKTIILVSSGLFLCKNINAKENEKPKDVWVSVANQTIKEHIKFPNLLLHINQEEKVNVVFTVNELGEVNLVVANTQNNTLKKSIEAQFMKLKIDKLKANNAYSVVLNFKKI